MRDAKPSFTAAFVATARGLGGILPADARLVEDPLGLRVGGLGSWFAKYPGPFRGTRKKFVFYMQVRTRAFDDVVTAFLASGGDQVVILGAGYDTRAARLGKSGVQFFEVDHPATQQSKRALVGSESTATYVSWDFEKRTVDDLPAALREAGHDPARRTLTIWEGVTMYLSESAIDATVRAIHAYSAPSSTLAFNYLERWVLESPRLFHRVVTEVVKVAGEPFTFGWDHAALPAWLKERGFDVASDKDLDSIAKELLPAKYANNFDAIERRICVATRE